MPAGAETDLPAKQSTIVPRATDATHAASADRAGGQGGGVRSCMGGKAGLCGSVRWCAFEHYCNHRDAAAGSLAARPPRNAIPGPEGA